MEVYLEGDRSSYRVIMPYSLELSRIKVSTPLTKEEFLMLVLKSSLLLGLYGVIGLVLDNKLSII